jgi:hypothetical protein
MPQCPAARTTRQDPYPSADKKKSQAPGHLGSGSMVLTGQNRFLSGFVCCANKPSITISGCLLAAFHQWHKVPSSCLRAIANFESFKPPPQFVGLRIPAPGFSGFSVKRSSPLRHHGVATGPCGPALSLNPACKHADPFLAVTRCSERQPLLTSHQVAKPGAASCPAKGTSALLKPHRQMRFLSQHTHNTGRSSPQHTFDRLQLSYPARRRIALSPFNSATPRLLLARSPSPLPHWCHPVHRQSEIPNLDRCPSLDFRECRALQLLRSFSSRLRFFA